MNTVDKHKKEMHTSYTLYKHVFTHTYMLARSTNVPSHMHTDYRYAFSHIHAYTVYTDAFAHMYMLAQTTNMPSHTHTTNAFSHKHTQAYAYEHVYTFLT
jgi:hypothetical protein